MRAQQWHCQSHLRGWLGGGGRERESLALFVVVGLVAGRKGGEMGILGVKGEGGTVRWEERKGVGVIVSAERIFLCLMEEISWFFFAFVSLSRAVVSGYRSFRFLGFCNECDARRKAGSVCMVKRSTEQM